MINLDIVTPESHIFSSSAHLVTFPGSEGEFGVLVDHIPFISSLKPGVIRLLSKSGDEEKCFFVSSGFVEVTGTEVIALAEYVVETDKIDLKPPNQNINL